MRIDVYHHLDDLDGVTARLDRIEAALLGLQSQGAQLMADLSVLTAEVERNTAVDESAIALLTGLAAQIEALKTDPVALQSLADTMRGSSDALAAAVVANTPVAPPVV
jgi:hypothetical protein